MRKITLKQFERIKRSKPKIHRTPGMIRVINMEVGEALIIDRKDWVMKKTNVVVSIHSLARSERLENGQEKKFRVKTLPDGSGWAVTRII